MEPSAEITALLRGYAKPYRPVRNAVPAYGIEGVGTPSEKQETQGVPWHVIALGLLTVAVLMALRPRR